MIVTTPNQLSLLSKLTLVLKNEFNAFQAGSYPAHLTALLEADLRRIGVECGWVGRGRGIHRQRPDPGDRHALAAFAVPDVPARPFR